MSDTLIDTALIERHRARFSDLRDRLEQRLALSLDHLRDRRLHNAAVPPTRLLDGMRYSLMAGGKRLRPILVLCAAEATGGRIEEAWPAALAIEYLHTYSLIHDDLPAMDDDDLRRGRPTLHKAFDEATAVLAGDALLTESFGLLARSQRNADRMVMELATAGGACGMVGGQMLDIEAEKHCHADIDLERIHRAKTGRLFVAAAVLGGLAAGAPQQHIALLRRYGAALGHAFQVADDLLDVIGDVSTAGKSLHRDSDKGKFTYVTRDGLEATRAEAKRLGAQARSAIASLGPPAIALHVIVELAVNRVA